MDNYVDRIKRAKEMVANEKTEYGSPEERIKDIVLAWLACDSGAAAMVLDESKSIKGAYKHMEKTAESTSGGRKSVCLNPEQATRAIMVYYGVPNEEAAKSLEHGLMYEIMQTMNRAEMERYKPYEGTVKDDATKTDAAKADAEPAKPQLATEIPSGNSFAEGLAELSLEDML